MNHFEVTAEDVTRINPGKLHELLNQLLLMEARRNSIPLSSVHHTPEERLTIRDRGQDLLMFWEQGVTHTDFIPARKTVFQAKATAMTETDCVNEVLAADGTLKERVAEVIGAGCGYVLVSNQFRGIAHRDDLCAAIKKGILQGKSDADLSHTKIEFYDPETLKNWINLYPTIVSWVKELLHQQTYDGLSFQKWSRAEANHEPYFEDEVIKNRKEELLSQISNSASKVIPIRGASGVGKTRLLLEALNSDDENTSSLRASVIYTNTQTHAESDIKEIARGLLRTESFAIFIVDDCSKRLEEDLKQLVTNRDAAFKLITIDSIVLQSRSDIFIIPPSSDEVIEKIVRFKFPEIDDGRLREIKKLAQGYPVIAVMIADALESNQPIHEKIQDSLINRMLWGREEPTPNQNYVAQTCALFEDFGCSDEVSEEMEHLRLFAEATAQDFSDVFTRLKDRRIIQLHGRYAKLEPTPIAIRLLHNWWQHSNSKTKVRDALLGNTNLPKRLLRSLCERLRLLDTVKDAKSVVAELCEGPDSPFANAEVLNTELGSECFRALVEVNPEASLRALNRAFSSYSVEEFKTFTTGRRHLVWALEKLVFRGSCFHDAAVLLLKLASSETETWSNNATGQFKQLFQLQLAGTEVGYPPRLKVMDEGIEMGIPSVDKVLISTIGHAFDVFHFSRMGSSERQGSGTLLTDYHPQTYGEMKTYLAECLTRLKRLIFQKRELTQAISQIDSGMIRGLLHIGMLSELKNLVLDLEEYRPLLLPKVLSGCALFLGYEEEEEGKENSYLAEIEEFYEEMWPSTLKGQLELLLLTDTEDIARFKFLKSSLNGAQQASTDDEEDDDPFAAENKIITQLAQRAAVELEFVYSVLPNVLSQGNHERSYTFGYELAKAIPRFQPLLDNVLALVKASSSPKLGLIKGIIRAVYDRDSSVIDYYFASLAKDKTFDPYFVELLCSKPISNAELNFLLGRITNGEIPVNQLRLLTYGGVIKSVSTAELSKFLKSLMAYSPEASALSIDMLSMYAYGRGDILQDFQDLLPELLMSDHVFDAIFEKGNRNSLDKHHYEVLFKWSLKNLSDTSSLTSGFLNKVFAKLELKDFAYPSEKVIGDMAEKIIKLNPTNAWETIAQNLVSASELARYRAGNVLGERFAQKDAQDWVFQDVPVNLIIDWCKKNQPIGAQFIIALVPLLNPEHSGWHPVLQNIIDNLGDDEGVISALTTRLGSFSWSGNIANYYSMFIKPVESLVGHSIPLVSSWAKDYLMYLYRQVEDSNKRFAEHEIGIY